MIYKLYGDKRSGSATIELALAEIGVEFDVSDVSIEDDQQRGSAYAAINPQGKLPTLITPDGETLTESASILLTLTERHPQANLLPKPGSAERAHALRWLLFIATELYPVIEIIDYPRRFQPDGEAITEDRCEALRDQVRGIWKRRWRLVEEVAVGKPWFLASGFSLLDIYAGVISRWGQVKDWRAANLPRIEGMVTAMATRPAVAPIWQRHFG